MPSIPGATNFVVHATKDDSTIVDFPAQNLNDAIQIGNDLVATPGGEYVSYTITYTDAHGRDNCEYDQN